MGQVLGVIIGEIVEALGTTDWSRASVANAIRAVAESVERGNIVPDQLLQRMQNTAARVAATREKYK